MADPNVAAPADAQEVTLMLVSNSQDGIALKTAVRLAAQSGAAVVLVPYASAEERVPLAHPLREVRTLTDDLLRETSREFDDLYARVGRPSVPPARLLRALLLQIFFSIRSERLLVEQLTYNLLFRWFVGLELDDSVWTPSVFAENRTLLVNQPLVQSFFRRVIERARPWLVDEHFSLDEPWLDP